MKVRQWIWSVYSIKLRRTDKNTGMPRGWQERGVIMTKIDIISGFLGAGKTTLINHRHQVSYGSGKAES